MTLHVDFFQYLHVLFLLVRNKNRRMQFLYLFQENEQYIRLVCVGIINSLDIYKLTAVAMKK